MQESEALELIDAYLEDVHLTEEQVAALTGWIQENSQHAERAFRRIFLHSFLRRRLQAQRLPQLSDSTELVPLRKGQLDPFTTLHFPQTFLEAAPARSRFPSWAVPLACVIAVIAILGAGFLAWPPVNGPSPAEPAAVDMASVEPIPDEPVWVYEGFDYPATSIPAPELVAQTWPTSGGLQGLDGGTGWGEPWQETGPKVAVIIDHARELNWDPKDMRKFKPLGHTDAAGRTLHSTGLQMRTAMGVRSLTSRKFDLSVFPESMKDESGLGVDGTTIWFSFLAQSFNSTASNNRFTYFQIGSRDVSGFRVGKVGAAPSGNWTALGLLTGAQVNLRSSTVPSGEIALIVTRLEFRPGPEFASVWINPRLETEPSLSEATLSLSVPDFRFDGITINANFSTDIDEIRFGPTFRSVAPVR